MPKQIRIKRVRRKRQIIGVLKKKYRLPPFRRLKYNNTGIGALQRNTIKLRYMIPWTAGNGTNTYNSQVFNMNSVFSPLAGGGGNQPRYFDQWAAIYNKYIVHAAKVNLMYTSTSTNNQTILAIGGYSHNDIAQTGITGVIENPHYKVKTLPNLVGSTRSSVYYICNKIEGMNKKAYREEPNFQATTAGNPTYLPHIEIAMAHIDGSTAVPTNQGYRGWIDYYVTFFDAKYPSQS